MKVSKRNKDENRQIAVVAYFFLTLFLAMLAYLLYFQIFKSEEFINSPYNSLQNLFAERIERGEIMSSDGVILAKTVDDENGGKKRVYPYGELFAHVTGYDAMGRAGLESIANFRLLRSHQFFLEQIANDLKEEKSLGDRVVSTVDFDLQEAAYQAMGDYKGAVIALDPSTGDILCMVSKPVYDPGSVEAEWDRINEEGSTVLFNRATQGLYAPGSTFKIFTTLAYISQFPDADMKYDFECQGTITAEDTTIRCAGNHIHGHESLIESFANSCNCSYANIGLSMDRRLFEEKCESLLFNENLPTTFLAAESSFALLEGDDDGLVMQTAMGQGGTLVTPLHMAMISAAVANEGLVMKPKLISRIENHKGVLVRESKPISGKKILSSQEAEFMRRYMREVVTGGTAERLKACPYECFGKTGTAQTTTSLTQTNAWFTGFAEEDGRQIAIAVILENAGAGSAYAVPVAKAVFDCYFSEDESCE